MSNKLADWYHAQSSHGQDKIRARQAEEWEPLSPLAKQFRYWKALYIMNKRPFVAILAVGVGLLAGWAYLAQIPVLYGVAAITLGVGLGIILAWTADN